jgi:hypothetical protein
VRAVMWRVETRKTWVKPTFGAACHKACPRNPYDPNALPKALILVYRPPFSILRARIVHRYIY